LGLIINNKSKCIEWSSIILFPVNLVGMVLTIPIVGIFWGFIFLQYLIGKQRKRAKELRRRIK